MNSNPDSGSPQVAQLSPPGEKPVWFTYSSGDRPLEGYTIKRGIGSGGFGEVYYAVSDGGKEVALKQIQRHLDVELRGVSQCLNLKHPNLVVLYDVKQTERGESWVVMEFVAGENLAEVIERHPQGMPHHEVLSLLRGICDGVSYLHEHGIVHRDLKPGNIFIENNQVKIGDYGLAKFISASRRSGQTESVGTVHYMAPELAHGRYGKEIDLYAIGVIVYEMLTGRVPFHGQSPGEVLMKHLTAAPDTSVLLPAFQPIVARLLAKTPEARYPSLEMMLADLDDCLAGRPRVAAAPPDRSHHAPRDVSLPPLPGAEGPNRPHHAERDGYGAGRRVASLQFWMDQVHGGLSTAEGMIRFAGDALVLDFRVKPLGMVNMALQEVRIALADLDRIHIDEGWFTTKLVIQTTRPQALANLPTSGICQATLRIARNDREAARDFIAGVTTAQRGHAAGGERPITLGAAGFNAQPAGAGAAHGGYGHTHGSARTDRLVRPVDDRVWLGVCSGLAARIGIDPVPIRVLWVLLTLFSSGMFLLAYLVVAMIMPESSQPSPIAPGTGRIRRLVRPRTDRQWAGVCSGVAAYFGMDPVWVRVFTVVLTFLTGFIPGLFVYLVLCWAMPEGEPAARTVHRVADLPVPASSLSYFGRVVARLPIAIFCGGGVGAMIGATCQMMGGIWGDEVAAFFGVGSGLLTAAIMLVVLCRGLGWPHSFWPAWTTLFAGVGTGLTVAGMSLVRFHGRANDVVAAFAGVGCGLLAAAFVGFTLYASLNRPLGWRWIFVVPFLGVGAGLLSGGASVLLNVRDEIGALVSVGVGLLVAGGLAWMLIFGRWAERLRPASALAGGSSGGGGAGSDLKQTMTFYGPGVSNRAMILGPSLFLIVLCIAWLGAYAAFWLHGVRQPLREIMASAPGPVVIDWEVNRFGGHQGSVRALAFDSAGKRLATGDSQGVVKVWDLATNTELRTLSGHNNAINAVAFNSDGTRLAASADCRDVRVWNLETGDEVCKSIEHPGPVFCVAFSPDGTQFVTGSSDDVVRLLDATTGKLVKQFFGCKAHIESVAFLTGPGAPGRLAAVGQNETQIRIWDIGSGRQLKPLTSGTAWLKGFVVSPDGRRVAGREFSGTVHLWDTDSGNRIGGFSTNSGGSNHTTLAFGPDGGQIATIDWPELKLREVPSGRVMCTFKGHIGTINAVAISPDGNHVVSAGNDNTVRMWELPATLRRSAPTVHSEAAAPPAEMEIPVQTPKAGQSTDSGGAIQ